MPVASQSTLYTAEDQWNDLVGVAKEPPPEPAPAPTTAGSPESYYDPSQDTQGQQQESAPPASPPPPPASPPPAENASVYYGGQDSAYDAGQAAPNGDQITTYYPSTGAPAAVTNVTSPPPPYASASTDTYQPSATNFTDGNGRTGFVPATPYASPSTDTYQASATNFTDANGRTGFVPARQESAAPYGPDMWQGRDIQNAASPTPNEPRYDGPSLSPQVNERGSRYNYMTPDERKSAIARKEILPDRSSPATGTPNANDAQTTAERYGINLTRPPGTDKTYTGLLGTSETKLNPDRFEPGPINFDAFGNPITYQQGKDEAANRENMLGMWGGVLSDLLNTGGAAKDYYQADAAGYHEPTTVHPSVDTRISVPGVGGTQDWNRRREAGGDISSYYYDPTALPHVDQPLPSRVVDGGRTAAPAAVSTTQPEPSPVFPGMDRWKAIRDQIGRNSEDTTYFGVNFDPDLARQKIGEVGDIVGPALNDIVSGVSNRGTKSEDGGGPQSVRGKAVEVYPSPPSSSGSMPTPQDIMDAAGQWLSDRANDPEGDRQRVIDAATQLADIAGTFYQEHAPQTGGGSQTQPTSGGIGGKALPILRPDGSRIDADAIRRGSAGLASPVEGTPIVEQIKVDADGTVHGVGAANVPKDAWDSVMASPDEALVTLSEGEWGKIVASGVLGSMSEGGKQALHDQLVGTPGSADYQKRTAIIPAIWAAGNVEGVPGGNVGDAGSGAVDTGGSNAKTVLQGGSSGTVDANVAAGGTGGTSGSGAGVDYYPTGRSGGGSSGGYSGGGSSRSGGGRDYYAPEGFGSDGGGESWADDPIFSAFFDVLDRSNPEFAAKVRSMFQRSGRGGMDFGRSGSSHGYPSTSRRSRSRRSMRGRGGTTFPSSRSSRNTTGGKPPSSGGTRSRTSSDSSSTDGSKSSDSTPQPSPTKKTRRSGK